jgi:NAD(P)-dependent dehydrogenase (short-subunit alcohol dehydrogenase family)
MKPIAVITGAARPDGIGWATALAFAAKGYEVLVTGGSEAEVAGAKAHPAITAQLLDVRDDAAVRGFFGRLDRLDALVNCAGAADPQGEYTSEGFSRVVDINLTGTHRCCLAAKDLLAKAHGAIVNVGSIYSTFGSAATPAYSASKGAIVQLTRSLAIAWGPDIRVNAVAPGWIQTGMAAPVFENREWAGKLIERLPLGRFGVPADLADPIVFLCSPEARYVSGVLLPVDGGYIVQG